MQSYAPISSKDPKIILSFRVGVDGPGANGGRGRCEGSLIGSKICINFNYSLIAVRRRRHWNGVRSGSRPLVESLNLCSLPYRFSEQPAAGKGDM